MYAKHAAHSVYEASFAVEAAHAIFKNLKEFHLKRLSDLIMRTFDLADQQSERSLHEVAQSRLAASQQPLNSSLNNLFLEVRSKLSDYAVRDLLDTMKR
jgi:HPt (histidine-containing phosphotransfer) domain-containing protein